MMFDEEYLKKKELDKPIKTDAEQKKEWSDSCQFFDKSVEKCKPMPKPMIKEAEKETKAEAKEFKGGKFLDIADFEKFGDVCVKEDNDWVELDQTLNKFLSAVAKARTEAMKRGIEANAIFISNGLIYSKLSDFAGGDVPIVCGLKAIYDSALPQNIEFIMTNAHNLPNTQQEEIKRLEEENKQLRDKIKSINKAIKDISDGELDI